MKYSLIKDIILGVTILKKNNNVLFLRSLPIRTGRFTNLDTLI